MLIRLNFMAIGCLDTDAAELDYEDNFFDAIIDNSNFAHVFCLCTLKIQYLAVIQLSQFRCYAA